MKHAKVVDWQQQKHPGPFRGIDRLPLNISGREGKDGCEDGVPAYRSNESAKTGLSVRRHEDRAQGGGAAEAWEATFHRSETIIASRTLFVITIAE